MKAVARLGSDGKERFYMECTEEEKQLYDEQMAREGIFKREVGRRASGDKIICYERDFNKKEEIK